MIGFVRFSRRRRKVFGALLLRDVDECAGRYTRNVRYEKGGTDNFESVVRITWDSPCSPSGVQYPPSK